MYDKKKRTFSVEMQVTPAEAVALTAFFDHWNHLASIGSSRRVSFTVGGNWSFRPECQCQYEGELPDLDTPIGQLPNKRCVKSGHEHVPLREVVQIKPEVFDYDPAAMLIEE